jgi:hypothetical protein
MPDRRQLACPGCGSVEFIETAWVRTYAKAAWWTDAYLGSPEVEEPFDQETMELFFECEGCGREVCDYNELVPAED